MLYNIFDAEDSDTTATRDNICSLEIPNFSEYREDGAIDERLNEILLRSLAKDKSERYDTASEMLEALEKYIYSEGYGPTNEKLAAYLSGFEELAG